MSRLTKCLILFKGKFDSRIIVGAYESPLEAATSAMEILEKDTIVGFKDGDKIHVIPLEGVVTYDVKAKREHQLTPEDKTEIMGMKI